MRRRSHPLPACLCALTMATLLAETAPAQETAPTDEPGDQTVVITASRSQQARFEADRSVEVLDREQLAQAQPRSLPEAVAETAGAFLQQTNRGAGAPFLRGLVGPQNLILVDGIRFNTATYRTGPNQYLALIDPHALARIEVLRGPSSVLYGNGAMGGVIQVLTLDPDRMPTVRAASRLASADTSAGFTVQAGPSFDELHLLAGASLDHFGPLRAGEGQMQPHSDYRSAAWQAKLAWLPVPGIRLTGATLGASIHAAGRMDRAGNGDLRFYDNTDQLTYLRLDYSSTGWLRQARLAISHQRLAESVERHSCRVATDGTVVALQACFDLAPAERTRWRRYQDTVDVLGADASAQAALWGDRLFLQAGLEAYQEWIGSSLQAASPASGWLPEPQAQGNYAPGSDFQTLGAFAHLQATAWDFGPGRGQIRLTGGLRVSHFAASAENLADIGDVAYAHTGLVGSAGLQWLLPGRVNLYFTFAQGFRAPNLQETTQLGDTGQKFSVPNPELGPERSDTLEAGGRLLLGPLSLSVTYFHSYLSDAITWQAGTWQGQDSVEGKPVTRLVNATEGIHQGVESQLELHWRGFSLSGTLTWMRGDETLADGTVQPARWIPPLFGGLGLRYSLPDGIVWAEALLRAAGRQDRLHPEALKDSRTCESAPYSGILREPCDGLPGWVALGLRAGFRPAPDLALVVALQNLGDLRYRTHGSGFDMPGIDLRVSLQAAY